MFGLGQAVPPPKRAIPLRYSAKDLPIETRRACNAAVVAGQYPNAIACHDAVRAGGAVPMLDAPLTTTGAPESKTGLYVGIGVAVLVVGLGAYLITR